MEQWAEIALKFGLNGLVIMGAGWIIRDTLDKLTSLTGEVLKQSKEDKQSLYLMNVNDIQSLKEANKYQRDEHDHMKLNISHNQELLKQMSYDLKRMQDDIEKGRVCKVH